MNEFSSEKFDIIIQGGQSNCVGMGVGVMQNPYIPDNRVWHLEKNGNIIIAGEKNDGPNLYMPNMMTKDIMRSDLSLEFTKRYIQDGLLEKDRKLLVVRGAENGSGFYDHKWGLQEEYFLQMLDMTKSALAMNPENRLVAFLWHQGELDADHNMGYETHYNNLSNLLKATREEFHAPELPFIAGGFTPHWYNDNCEKCEPVIKAIKDVCNEKYAAFVETDGLKSGFEEHGSHTGSDGHVWDDTIHFSRAALYELGQRYYEAFKKIPRS